MAPEGSEHKIVYEGVASEYQRQEGITGEPHLRYAILNAYEKGISEKPPKFDEEENQIPYQFRIVGLFVEGINPPTDYRAHLVDHP